MASKLISKFYFFAFSIGFLIGIFVFGLIGVLIWFYLHNKV